jgi:sugar/nucleoside kinase (ribokinase family)
MTADLTPSGRFLGGTVSYAARTVSALGLRVGVLTSAMPDDPLLADLERLVTDMVVIPAESTSTFENIYASEVRQQFIRGVAEPLTYESIPESWRGAPLVHFGPLTGEIDPSKLFGRFPNAIRLLTGQGLMRQWDETGLVKFKRWYDPVALRQLDWLVLSEEDIVLAPELEQEYAASVANFVMTRAERGGTHYQNGAASEYSTPQVSVSQPTGAGDVFAAALLAALHLLDGDVSLALQVAAKLGSAAVTRDGLEGAPTVEEAQAALDAAKATRNAR